MSPATALLDLLAPPRCLACGMRSSLPWCRPCARAASALEIRSACPRCASPSAQARHGCWDRAAPIAGTVAVYRYAGPVARAIVAGKARGARAAWPALGERLASRCGATLPAADIVTWVPTDPRRRRERGVDHAEVLARVLADATGRPVVPTLVVRSGRPDQAARAPAERARVPEDDFRSERALAGARVLLVDDVVTSGGTARAAARALAGAGAAAVHLVVLARAGDHPLGRGG